MARCRECIHGECCSVFIPIRTTLCNDNADEMCKLFKPAADVVPKSEVEQLKEKLCKSRKEVMRQRECICEISTEHDELIDEFENAKTEVALKVIKEAERILNVKIIGIEEDFFHGTAAHWDAARRECYEEVLIELAELKKKYTQNCTACKHMVSCEPNPFGSCDEYTEDTQ